MTALPRAIFSLLMFCSPALAEDPFQDGAPCDDLWFSRNAMLDKAGYCFASPLGQAVFDNSDCVPGAVTVDEMTQTAIQAIRAREAFFQCDVDTGRKTLDLDPHDIARRKVLDIQPVEEALWQFEYSCVGYVGDPLPIRSAPITDALTIGTVQPGALLNFHRGIWIWDLDGNELSTGQITPTFPGWIFTAVLGPGTAHIEGWIQIPKDALTQAEFGGICEGVAG